MSLKDCIIRALDAQEMDPTRAQEVIKLYDEILTDVSGKLSESEATRYASTAALKALKNSTIEKKRKLLLQAKVAGRIMGNLEKYRNSAGEKDFAAAMVAHFDHDSFAPFSNVVSRRKAIRGRLHANMHEVLAKHKKDLLGRERYKADMKNMVREVFGEDTGDIAAKEFANAWQETSEFARLQFNAAGGRIGKRADWGMPQAHDSLKVRKSTFNEWRDFILPKLDPSKMIDELTGEAITSEKLELALRDIYETISTDGFSKVKPSGVKAGKALSNRHADHRFLAFRDSDSWLSYQEQYGKGDPFDVMMSHIDRMSRDIALLEVLGPNPKSTMTWMEQVVRKEAALSDAAAGTDKAMNRANKAVYEMNEMYGVINGENTAPIGKRFARSFAGLRSLLTSAQLGSAAISAISDVGFSHLAARHAGLSHVGVLQKQLKLLNPANIEDRKLAVRLGLIAEEWSSVASAQARYVGEVSGPETAQRISDFVLRSSGLSAWTQAGRWAFGMEFMGTLADNIAKDFSALNPALRRTLKNYGIDQTSWDIIRKTELYDYKGAKFLRPEEIAARGDISPTLGHDLTNKVLEMIQSETEYAVPSSSLRGQIAITGNTKPGTIQGELLRSVAMYKNFPVTLMHTHGQRMVNQQGLYRKGAYAAQLAISTTVMGALAMQLKEIAKGRDPRSMTGKKAGEFWGAAILQGGGLGIFGDFLFSDVNRFGGSLGDTVAGPVFGFLDDTRRLTIGNMLEAVQGKDTKFGRDLTNFARRYTPGSSIWYARLGIDLLIMDTMQRELDPDARKVFAAQERRIRKEYGQKYFWRPGQTSPSRLPDLSQAVEE